MITHSKYLNPLLRTCFVLQKQLNAQVYEQKIKGYEQFSNWINSLTLPLLLHLDYSIKNQPFLHSSKNLFHNCIN